MFCELCQSTCAVFRNRLDNMHTALRMCGKEGRGFRQEVENFVCLSPAMAITYNLKSFYQWMDYNKTKAAFDTRKVPFHVGK